MLTLNLAHYPGFVQRPMLILMVLDSYPVQHNLFVNSEESLLFPHSHSILPLSLRCFINLIKLHLYLDRFHWVLWLNKLENWRFDSPSDKEVKIRILRNLCSQYILSVISELKLETLFQRYAHDL